MFVAFAAISFASCGNKAETVAEVADSVAVDTVAADSVVADSAAADSVVADSVVA